jgi:hypothetical protein
MKKLLLVLSLVFFSSPVFAQLPVKALALGLNTLASNLTPGTTLATANVTIFSLPSQASNFTLLMMIHNPATTFTPTVSLTQYANNPLGGIQQNGAAITCATMVNLNNQNIQAVSSITGGALTAWAFSCPSPIGNIAQLSIFASPSTAIDIFATVTASGTTFGANVCSANVAPTCPPVVIAGINNSGQVSDVNVSAAGILTTGGNFIPTDNISISNFGQTGLTTGVTGPIEVEDIVFNSTGSYDRLFRCSSKTFISALGASTALLVTGVAARQVRICYMHISNDSATATNLTFIEGTGGTCGTGTATMTGKYHMNANTTGGDDVDILFNNFSSLNTATAGDSVCVTGSAAGSADITVIYTTQSQTP